MSRSLKAAMPRPERAYRMGAISFSGSSSSGWPSKLRLLVRQGVDEGEAWGLLRPCRNITHSMPFNTARHRYVLSVWRGKDNLKGQSQRSDEHIKGANLLVVFSEAMYFHSCLQECLADPGERLPEELVLSCRCTFSRRGFFCKGTVQLQTPSPWSTHIQPHTVPDPSRRKPDSTYQMQATSG